MHVTFSVCVSGERHRFPEPAVVVAGGAEPPEPAVPSPGLRLGVPAHQTAAAAGAQDGGGHWGPGAVLSTQGFPGGSLSYGISFAYLAPAPALSGAAFLPGAAGSGSFPSLTAAFAARVFEGSGVCLRSCFSDPCEHVSHRQLGRKRVGVLGLRGNMVKGFLTICVLLPRILWVVTVHVVGSPLSKILTGFMLWEASDSSCIFCLTGLEFWWHW